MGRMKCKKWGVRKEKRESVKNLAVSNNQLRSSLPGTKKKPLDNVAEGELGKKNQIGTGGRRTQYTRNGRQKRSLVRLF